MRGVIARVRRRHDPFWDFFIFGPVADPRNFVTDAIRVAPDGSPYPVQTEQHSADVTAAHLKELGRFWGAHSTGVAKLAEPLRIEESGPYQYAVILVVVATHDVGMAQGIGGQGPVLTGAYITFEMSAYIRELGFHATRTAIPNADSIAVSAGLGTLNRDGKLVAAGVRYAYVPDIIVTDLPLAHDGEAIWPHM